MTPRSIISSLLLGELACSTSRARNRQVRTFSPTGVPGDYHIDARFAENLSLTDVIGSLSAYQKPKAELHSPGRWHGSRLQDEMRAAHHMLWWASGRAMSITASHGVLEQKWLLLVRTFAALESIDDVCDKLVLILICTDPGLSNPGSMNTKHCLRVLIHNV